MTNAEKFKTAEERNKAFGKFCLPKDCSACSLNGEESCKFAWLELEAHLTAKEVADILEEHNKWRRGEGAYSEPGAWSPQTPNQLSMAIDRAVELLREKNNE